MGFPFGKEPNKKDVLNKPDKKEFTGDKKDPFSKTGKTFPPKKKMGGGRGMY